MNLKEIRKKDHDLIKIGKIARVIKSANDPKQFTSELFLVTGFQVDIYGEENFIVLFSRDLKTFIAHKDNVVVQEKLSIDHMFKSQRSCKYEN